MSISHRFMFFMLLIYPFFLLSGLLAQNVSGTAVLIDISASMRYKGNWQEEVRRTLNDLLFGGNINEDIWIVEGVRDQIFYDGLKSGKITLYRSGLPLLILPFGTVQKDEEPFFNNIYLNRFDNLNRAKDFINNHFPSQFNDPWTFIDLAKAVARNKMVLDNKVKSWYLIIITDLEKSYPKKYIQKFPNADHIAIKYPTTVTEKAKVTFSYRKDKRLKMIIYTVEYQKPIGDNGPQITTITLINPKNGMKIPKIDKRNILRFRWKNIKGVSIYSIIIRDKNNKIIDRKKTRRSVLSYNKPLKSGVYLWSVEGRLSTGGKAVSSRWRFEVGGQGGGGFLVWVVLILLVGLPGYYFLNNWLKRKRTQ